MSQKNTIAYQVDHLLIVTGDRIFKGKFSDPSVYANKLLQYASESKCEIPWISNAALKTGCTHENDSILDLRYVQNTFVR